MPILFLISAFLLSFSLPISSLHVSQALSTYAPKIPSIRCHGPPRDHNVFLVIGLFQSIPLTTIQPIYNFPERLHGRFRLGYVAGRLGDVFDMLFPARHGNGSFVDQEAWPATLSIPDVALTRAVATSEPSLCPGASRLVRSDDASIEVHATGTKCQAANIDYLGEYCQRRDRLTSWNDFRSESCSDATTSAYIHESVKSGSILTVALVALVVLAAILATAARIQRQCTAAIEEEIQTIISKIGRAHV